MKRWNDKRPEEGDVLAHFIRGNPLPVKVTVVKSNKRFFEIVGGKKFSHETWDEWGCGGSFYCNHVQAWDQGEYDRIEARMKFQHARRDFFDKLQSFNWDVIARIEDYERVIAFCGQVLDEYKLESGDGDDE